MNTNTQTLDNDQAIPLTSPSTLDASLTPGAGIAKALRSYLAPLMIALGSVGAVSCDKEDPTPIEAVDPNKLTEEQQKFADLLKPYADGSPKFIIVDIKTDNPRYDMPGLFKIEMKLVDAKAGTFEITPIISKKPLEDVLKNARIDQPNTFDYGVNLSLVVKKNNGATYSPTGTNSIQDEDDNNPSTPFPFLAQLPESFTMDLFKNYNPNTTATKSYVLNKDEELQVWIKANAVGAKFTEVQLPFKPVEQLALAN